MSDIETVEDSFSHFVGEVVVFLDQEPATTVEQIMIDRKKLAANITIQKAGVGAMTVEVTAVRSVDDRRTREVKKAAEDAGFEYRDEGKPFDDHSEIY